MLAVDCTSCVEGEDHDGDLGGVLGTCRTEEEEEEEEDDGDRSRAAGDVEEAGG